MIIAVDVANRMQFDADGNYFDPFDYRSPTSPGRGLLGVSAANTSATYRRMYKSLLRLPPSAAPDVYTAELNPDPRGQEPDLQCVLVADAPGRGACGSVDRGPGQHPRRPLRPPQDAPTEPAHRRHGQRRACHVTSPTQLGPTPSGASDGRWRITTTVVDAANGSIGTAAAPVVAADAAGASTALASTSAGA